MARALVTGGCGFVGRHLSERLLAEGMDVVSKLQRTEGVPGKVEPDTIIKATVVKKRRHPYKPITRQDK